MPVVLNLISMAGGLALFLYGMRLMGDGLRKSSSGALKKAMEKVTNNPFVGFLLGLLVTAVIQSSTATIVLTSGLVAAGIITLRQSLGIIIGANVGTTATGWLVSLLGVNAEGSWLQFFQPSTLAPIAAVIGIVVIMFLKFRSSEIVGGISMGFAILFTGLLSMTAAVSSLSSVFDFGRLFTSLADKPFLGFLSGAGVAFAIQSSSATIGILQTLSAGAQGVTFSGIYAIILGIYIGDCVTTAIVCSIGAKADAKRTGMVHILYNLSKTVLIFTAVTVLHKTGALDSLWNRQLNAAGIALTHTVFNFACAILLLPVCRLFERASRVIIRDDKAPAPASHTEVLQTLDKTFYESPELAFGAARAVICEMMKLAQANVCDAMKVLDNYDAAAIRRIRENETAIDSMIDHVSTYLVHLSTHVEGGAGNDMVNYYLKCASEVERIGDHAVNLTENADDLQEHGVDFTGTAKAELALVRGALEKIMDYAYVAFKSKNLDSARHIEPVEEVVDDLVMTLRTNHLNRLKGGKCSDYAGFTFTDVLSNAEHVADQCSNIGVLTVSLSDVVAAEQRHDYIRQLHSGADPVFNEEYERLHTTYFDRLASIESAVSAFEA